MHLQLSLVCRFRLCRTLRDTFVPNVRQKFCFPLEVTFEHFCYFYFVITKYIDVAGGMLVRSILPEGGSGETNHHDIVCK